MTRRRTRTNRHTHSEQKPGHVGRDVDQVPTISQLICIPMKVNTRGRRKHHVDVGACTKGEMNTPIAAISFVTEGKEDNTWYARNVPRIHFFWQGPVFRRDGIVPFFSSCAGGRRVRIWLSVGI